jgi:hypothetical protein
MPLVVVRNRRSGLGGASEGSESCPFGRLRSASGADSVRRTARPPVNSPASNPTIWRYQLRYRVFLAAASVAVCAVAVGAGTAGAATKTYCLDGTTTATVADTTLQDQFTQFEYDSAIANFGGVLFNLTGRHTIAAGACASAAAPAADPPAPRPPDRGGYCLNGKFLNLVLGQPDTDPLYKGAVPALYVQGVGITCDVPGNGYALQRAVLVGPDGLPLPDGLTSPSVIYPYFAKSA